MKRHDSEIYKPKNQRTDRKYQYTVQSLENAMDWAKINKKQFPISLSIGVKEAFAVALPRGERLAPYIVSLVQQDIERRFANGELTEEDRVKMLEAYDNARKTHLEKMQEQLPNSTHLQDGTLKDDPWIEKLRNKRIGAEDSGDQHELNASVIDGFSCGVALDSDDGSTPTMVSDAPAIEYNPGPEKSTVQISDGDKDSAPDEYIINGFSYGLKIKND